MLRFLVLVSVLTTGCAVVPRYQREMLSHPGMSGDEMSRRSSRRFHFAREGASGGDGAAAGGGCGCGQ
jgi:hypothetical protein